ncbi:MAG: hypothetical protein WBQ94_10915 [Terracidiphilus sp.]
MAMSRFSLTLAAILILTSGALSQDPARPPVPIEPLLRNSELRLVAFGAWEVIRRKDDSFFPLMQEMVERWDPAQRLDFDENQSDAMTVILDAFIQRNAVLSIAGVTAIAKAFPDQALILSSRLPPEDAAPILLAWYENGKGVNRAHLDWEGADRLRVARVAAMMLAKNHPQRIAAALLADSTEYLAVSVSSEGSGGVDRCLVGCEAPPKCTGESGIDAQPGWPLVFRYVLEEYRLPPTSPNPTLDFSVLVQAGGDRIVYRRVRSDSQWEYCYPPAPLNAENRHHLIAEMLGVSEEHLPWQTQMNLTLPWQNDRRFLDELGAQVDSEEAGLRSTVQQFFAKGFISKTQAETIRPRLSITIFDDRQPAQPANLALPQLAVRDSRTTYRIGSWR